MSGFETLPPDQRAVLQLILVQGRGYAELAQLLKIDAGAVRARAHAGLHALAPAGEAPGPERREEIADYLLGQQDEGERLVTLVALGESEAASHWAGALRQQLAPYARDPLPEVPEPVSSNGTAAPSTVAAAAPAPAPEPPAVAQAPPPPRPAAPAVPPSQAAPASPPSAAAEPGAVAAPPTPPAHAEGSATPAAPAPRPSRLGGAILLVAAAAVAIVLAIVLIGGDDEPARTTASSTPQTTTQPSTTGSQPTAQVVAQVNLLATPEGGQAVGVGIVQEADGARAIALQAQKLPANGAQDIYAAWLSGPPGTKLLGFVPRQVKANGKFTVSAELPANAAQYDSVLITRESATGGKVPSQPGETIMRGALKLS